MSKGQGAEEQRRLATDRILAIDYGARRIGLAISDPLGITAQGLDTLQASSPKQALRALEALIEQRGVHTIVVGIPKNMDGTEGEQAAEVRAWAMQLEGSTGRRVVLWDERLTTVAAHQAMHAMGLKINRKRKGDVDRIAATMILREYLDSTTHEGLEYASKGQD